MAPIVDVLIIYVDVVLRRLYRVGRSYVSRLALDHRIVGYALIGNSESLQAFVIRVVCDREPIFKTLARLGTIVWRWVRSVNACYVLVYDRSVP